MRTKMRTMTLAVALTLTSLCAMAQTEEPIIINGNLINWYFYGKDDGVTGWHQQYVGGIGGTPSNYGLISLSVDPSKPNKKVKVDNFPIRNYVLYGNTAALWDGEAYYTFYMGEGNFEENIVDTEFGSEGYVVKPRRWTWDGISETPDSYGDYPYTNVAYETLTTMEVQPIDLTYDPLYDKVYGIFYNGSTYKFGMLDMETLAVTTISKEGIVFGAPRCIAINSQGEVYALDPSGYFYKIDKETGEMTTIGHTGVVSQNKAMSMTFDMRTDKLYWIGFMNNGKSSADPAGSNTTATVAEGGRDTGLYEINTSTGEATLIQKLDFKDVEILYDEEGDPIGSTTSEYGKMQLTGIYVEGSFTRKNVDQYIELLSLPTQMKAGEQGTITLRVKNIGLEKVLAKNYVINVYANDQLVATIDRDSEPDPVESMERGESQTFTVDYQAPIASGKVIIYAEVVNAADEEVRNNTTAKKTINVLSGTTLPMVSISGITGSTGVTLNWDDPNGHVIDGAEEYIAFTYDGLNEWTMVDGDGAATQSFNSWNDAVDYPNKNTPKAYIVFNPEEAGINLTGSGPMFTPHSGEQYFASIWSAERDDSEQGGHQVANSDWMISPELSGEAQTITFWAKGYMGSVIPGYETEANYPETMEVRYTTELSVDTAVYVVAKEEFTVNNEEWTKYEVDLPVGAKHFALHCTSAEGFVLMIDDIEFIIVPKTVREYRVYRNGQFEESVMPPTTEWSGSADLNDVFYVTVVYDEGESAASNLWTNGQATSLSKELKGYRIDELKSAEGWFTITGRSLSRRPTAKGVYVHGGKKVVIQ